MTDVGQRGASVTAAGCEYRLGYDSARSARDDLERAAFEIGRGAIGLGPRSGGTSDARVARPCGAVVGARYEDAAGRRGHRGRDLLHGDGGAVVQQRVARAGRRVVEDRTLGGRDVETSELETSELETSELELSDLSEPSPPSVTGASRGPVVVSLPESPLESLAPLPPQAAERRPDVDRSDDQKLI